MQPGCEQISEKEKSEMDERPVSMHPGLTDVQDRGLRWGWSELGRGASTGTCDA